MRREPRGLGGLMTRSEKEFVVRVQQTQLITDNAFLDDFYYMKLTQRRDPRSVQPAPLPVLFPKPLKTKLEKVYGLYHVTREGWPTY